MSDGQYVSLVLLASISLMANGGSAICAIWLPLAHGNYDMEIVFMFAVRSGRQDRFEKSCASSLRPFQETGAGRIAGISDGRYICSVLMCAALLMVSIKEVNSRQTNGGQNE